MAERALCCGGLGTRGRESVELATFIGGENGLVMLARVHAKTLLWGSRYHDRATKKL